MKKHAIGVDQAAQVPKRWALTKQLGPAPIACFMISSQNIKVMFFELF